MRKRTHIYIVAMMAFIFVGFTGAERHIELTGSFNARSSANFTQDTRNILFTLSTGTKAEILSHRKFNSGNYGLQVKVSSGPHAGKTVWVYYNNSRPHMKLDALPEAATQATATKPTPATPNVPVEIPLSQTTTVAQATCTNCETANNRPQQALQQIAQTAVNTQNQSPLHGALRTMAVLYQSCDVLKLDPYDPATDSEMGAYLRRVPVAGSYARRRVVPEYNLSTVANNHYYLKNSNQGQYENCADMRKTPPIYHYGGRPRFNGNEIDILATRNTGGAPIVGIDCSAFISAALSASGLKITPWVKNAQSNMTTSRALTSYSDSNSCFRRPSFSKNNTIQSGDIIAYPGHTFMIDKVGEDPFAIEQLKRAGRFPRSAAGCNRLEMPRRQLDFTIIQSSGYGDMPAMRIEAKNYPAAYQEMRNLFVQACMAEFQDVATRPQFGSVLLRHKGNENPACVFSEEQRPTLRGESCTGGCPQELT